MNLIVYSTEWKTYEAFNKKIHNYKRRCIDGKITGSNKCVAYCLCDKHPGFLTEKLKLKHDCENKKCFYFVSKY